MTPAEPPASRKNPTKAQARVLRRALESPKGQIGMNADLRIKVNLMNYKWATMKGDGRMKITRAGVDALLRVTPPDDHATLEHHWNRLQNPPIPLDPPTILPNADRRGE